MAVGKEKGQPRVRLELPCLSGTLLGTGLYVQWLKSYESYERPGKGINKVYCNNKAGRPFPVLGGEAGEQLILESS